MRASVTDLESVERELREALAPSLQVVRLLGRGAMGAVFLARDPALKRDVVVKVLAPELAHDEVSRRRFAREAETAAAVSHPNVVDIFHVGTLPRSGTSYFVMRYIAGPTLGDAIPLGTRVPQARCRRIVGEIASALAAAHGRGLVHRDIKPSNIMLDGPTERVVVLDFGISAAATIDLVPGEERLTTQGTSIGTPAYMSPEQAAGDAITDRSDVYSLGMVAYELLAGTPPFAAKSPVALIAAHIKDVPPPVSKARPDVESSFAALVDRMLAKGPEQRPSADEIARALLPGVHVIEWPPPGLESTLGLGVTGVTLLAFLAAAVPFDLLSGGASAALQRLLMNTLLNLAIVVLVCGGGIVLGIATGHARRAQKNGYPMIVVIDVLLDRAADTAALLNGTSIYASLPADTGMRWMRRRRWAAAMLLAASMTSLVVAVLWAIGIIELANVSTGESMTFAGFGVMELPVLFGLAAAVLIRRPEVSFRRRRQSREQVTGGQRARVPDGLVASWRASAAALVPRRENPLRARVLLGVVEWAIAVVVVVITGIIVASSVTSVASASSSVVPLDNSQYNRLRESLISAAKSPPLDSTLGAHGVPAGTALDTAALRTVASARDLAGVAPSAIWSALQTFPAPLPRDLAAALDTGARHPALDAMRRVAAGGVPPVMWYAPRATFSTAEVGRDSPRTNSLVGLASRNAAAAALDLTRGDTPSAVRRARENIAFGRLLLHDPLWPTYQRGIGIAGNGARLLREIGIAADDRALTREGDGLVAALAARRSVESQFTWFTLGRLGARPDDSILLSIAANRRLLPVDRWMASSAIARGVCWNDAELRTGVSRERRRALDEVERSLSDIPRSAEWIAVQRDFLRTIDRAKGRLPKGGPSLPIFISAVPMTSRTVLCGF